MSSTFGTGLDAGAKQPSDTLVSDRVTAALAEGSCRGFYLQLRVQGEHLALKDWGVGHKSNPYLRFRQLLRGARPLDYRETLADKDLVDGEYWSQPLFKDTRPARWEGDGGDDTVIDANQLCPRWRPVLLKLDRLVENGRVDSKFLIEVRHIHILQMCANIMHDVNNCVLSRVLRIT